MSDSGITDQRGNPVEVDTSKLPDGSPAKEGTEPTPPSGQGGATPHDGISYQDKWPANPPPSESAAAKGAENDEVATGDTNPVDQANEYVGSVGGGSSEPPPEEPPAEPQP